MPKSTKQEAGFAGAKHPHPELSHQGKIFWPKEKYTKGDLLEYYAAIAPVLLPYLRGRPESLHRFPNGISGKSFFQKNFTYKVPEFADAIKINLETEKRTINSLVINNLDALLYAVNLGCIELNPWNSRVSNLHNPDFMIIDLDPEGVRFERVVEVALAAHRVLEAAKIPSYIKTSGKTGMHIFVPLAARYRFEPVRDFAKTLAQIIHKEIPEYTSLERHPDKRKHKVYLDYLQNNIGQTIACAYSVRPWPGATVSAPLEWKEVKKGLNPGDFTIKTMPKRIARKGDLWKPVLGKGIILEQALQRVKKEFKI